GWEDVSNDGSAPRAERQSLDIGALAELAADRILGGSRQRLGIANRQRADALRRCDIPIKEYRRSLQRRRDIVETEVRIVAWQKCGDVDVEREQFADRVTVLRTIQTVYYVSARQRAARSPTAIQ